jgi:uncharacterized membrane protein YkoI
VPDLTIIARVVIGATGSGWQTRTVAERVTAARSEPCSSAAQEGSMRSTTRTLALAVTGALLALGARAAQAQPHIKGSASLKSRAKISGDSAMKIAKAQVPDGKIKSGEIEEEKGKLVYSFDISQAGKSGVEEVNVDAMTGAVMSKEHESAKMEKAEHKAEHKTEKAESKAAKPASTTPKKTP